MRLFAALLFFSMPASVAAQDVDDEPRYFDDELYAELVHSDVPLYGFDLLDFWPRSSIPEGAIAGCASRVRFGDWQFTPNAIDEYGDEAWWRITNYGVFHCAAIFRNEDERDFLAEAAFETGFFAKIGETERGDQNVELWVMQLGSRPGSEYVLLSRNAVEGIVEEFTVLQRRCPEGAMRVYSGNLDILSTEYCAINERATMLAFAMDMLELPPLGTLVLRGDSDWVPIPEPEESPPMMEDGAFLLQPVQSD